MNWALKPHPQFKGVKGPLVLAILDGVGIGAKDRGDAVHLANTPILDSFSTQKLSTSLFAHGKHVGLPSDDDMGNSEVGHNALGCGVIHDQGALLVNRAITSQAMFQGETWKAILNQVVGQGALHFVGLLSDGNVHSHIDHLIAMVDEAAAQGVKKIFVHALLDGRDVGSTTAEIYIEKLEKHLREFESDDIDFRIVSGGGRMYITMDRYEADWSMVQRGWDTHVHGDARGFKSAQEALSTLRAETPGISDQNLPAFVVLDHANEATKIVDGDAVINFNFRGDRAIEISNAFDAESFGHIDRGVRPNVLYAGMMEYDGDLHVPKRYLVEPPSIEYTMGEYLARNHVSQLAISETQKFGHVTYFWNGNRSGKFDEKTETYIEIESDVIPFDQRPEMKAREITDALILELRQNQPRFARVNYANGDMVGHTGFIDKTILAVETIDRELARLAKVVAELDGVLVISADHGNADDMLQRSASGEIVLNTSGQDIAKTSHSLNRVPFYLVDPKQQLKCSLLTSASAGIANISATCFELLGFVPPDGMQSSLLRFE